MATDFGGHAVLMVRVVTKKRFQFNSFLFKSFFSTDRYCSLVAYSEYVAVDGLLTVHVYMLGAEWHHARAPSLRSVETLFFETSAIIA
jgi:hypothetical protein